MKNIPARYFDVFDDKFIFFVNGRNKSILKKVDNNGIQLITICNSVIDDSSEMKLDVCINFVNINKRHLNVSLFINLSSHLGT